MSSFKVGDVLKNKHNGLIVRLLYENHINGSYGIMPVQTSGYVGFGGSDPEHWTKISIWVWRIQTLLFIVKQFLLRYDYKTKKELGMVDNMGASKYWQTYNNYVNVYKTVTEYNYIVFQKLYIEPDLPAWREERYNEQFEESIFIFLKRRIRHLL